MVLRVLRRAAELLSGRARTKPWVLFKTKIQSFLPAIQLSLSASVRALQRKKSNRIDNTKTEIYFKKLVHMMVGAGMSEICRAGQLTRNSGQSGYYSLELEIHTAGQQAGFQC